MNPIFLTIRAIGAEFANRIFLNAALIITAASLFLIALIIWLTSMSGWWWILATIIIAVISIAVLGLFFAKVIIRWVAPKLSRDQKKQTKVFVTELQSLSDITQTPPPLLLFYILRDMVFPREMGFIATLSQESSSLKQIFFALVRSFH